MKNTPAADKALAETKAHLAAATTALEAAIQAASAVRGLDAWYAQLQRETGYLDGLQRELLDLKRGGGLSLDSEPQVKP